MKKCRDCRHEVSGQACSCPDCGAPYPAREKWDGFGFEYRSQAGMFGIPFLPIPFKHRSNRTPVAAKGIIAIGQSGCGVITISQSGIGIASISRFTIAGYALAQFGLFLDQERGQLVWDLIDLLRRL